MKMNAVFYTPRISVKFSSKSVAPIATHTQRHLEFKKRCIHINRELAYIFVFISVYLMYMRMKVYAI